MRMKKFVWLVLLILVSVEKWCCDGCLKEERDGLLHLKAILKYPLLLTDWVDGTDCCQWSSVRCNSTSSRVAELDLFSIRPGDEYRWYLNLSVFHVFEDLRSLTLSSSEISGCAQNLGSRGFKNLQVLDLSYNHLNDTNNISCLSGLSSLSFLDLSHNYMTAKFTHGFSWPTSLEDLRLGSNNFNNDIISSLSDLHHLKSLDLSENQLEGLLDISGLNASLKVLYISHCHINSTLRNAGWYELDKLEELDLSSNELMGPLPSSFKNMTSLRMLVLSNNYFTGNIGSTLASLTSLEDLDFEENQFEVPASFSSLANHSSIKFISGHGNKVVPDPYSTIQPWIPKFQLQEFLLSSTIENHSLPLPHFLFYQYDLTLVDFSDWKFGVEFPGWLMENNTKLTDLILRNCSIVGLFPLPSHPNIFEIDASDNSITDTIMSENNSSIFPNLICLNVSKNKISGSFSELGLHSIDQIKFLNSIDVSYNYFSGAIPTSIFSTSLLYLDISNNNFDGKIPSSIGNSSSLQRLYMDNNHFEGSIPRELVELQELEYLDLSGNNLSGSIPSFFNASIKFIHMSNNRLKGFSARMFDENFSLRLLDLRYNEITSNLQDLIRNCTKLTILLLKGNNFIGPIPEQLCQLAYLTMVDLSDNNLSGPLPKCLGEIQFKAGGAAWNRHWIYAYYMRQERLSFVGQDANFTTKASSYTYAGDSLIYMIGMDLSHNKLDGNIPYELGNWTEIKVINMSHNYLTGEIPTTFSKMKQIESLDLSFNKLSGAIPPQLIELTFLEVFSVAYNNISGTTPEWKDQFATFDESSYVGNPFLCGPPLHKTCTNRVGDPSALVPIALDGEEDNDDFIDMQAFYVTFGVAYAMALLVMAAVLYINPCWRQAWFCFIEFIITNCYYFLVDFFYKLSTLRNM